MGDERFTTRRATSRDTSKPSTNQRLEYASQRAEVLFGCYRRGDANDPERYVSAIAAVLSDYDFELMRDVTDPRTGICTDEKYMTFMPNAGELKRFCEARAAHRDRLQKLGSRRPEIPADRYLPAPDPVPGHLANVHVPASNPRYAALVEWSKTADPRMWKFGHSSQMIDGIWVAHDIWDQRQTVARRTPDKAPSYALSDAAKTVMRDLDEVRNMGTAAE